MLRVHVHVCAETVTIARWSDFATESADFASDFDSESKLHVLAITIPFYSVINLLTINHY